MLLILMCIETQSIYGVLETFPLNLSWAATEINDRIGVARGRRRRRKRSRETVIVINPFKAGALPLTSSGFDRSKMVKILQRRGHRGVNVINGGRSFKIVLELHEQ